jgi:hypothetical protein
MRLGECCTGHNDPGRGSPSPLGIATWGETLDNEPADRQGILSAFCQNHAPTVPRYRSIYGFLGAIMSARFGSSPSTVLRCSGLFVTFFAVTLSVRSAVAFEDRFGDSPNNNRIQYTDSRRANGEGGAPGMSDRGGRSDGANSHGDEGGGFPGSGGRNSGPDDRRGPGRDGDDGSGGRGRGPGH